MTSELFNKVKERLAFQKSDKSALRGYAMTRFLEAQPGDKSWFGGLKEEQAVSFVSDSIKQWNVVYGITKCLGPDNEKLSKVFSDAHVYFVERIAANPLTAGLKSEFKD